MFRNSPEMGGGGIACLGPTTIIGRTIYISESSSGATLDDPWVFAGPIRYCHKDALPFSAMVAVECINVGLNILFKASNSKGLSYYVFITYTSAIATLVLLPLVFIFRGYVSWFPVL